MATQLEEHPTLLLEDVRRPISDGNPAGDDISYDDDFLQLKDMVDQLSSVDPGSVDFGVILEKSQALLGQKAKDLRVSSYLAMALAQTNGLQGVLEGLTAQKVLCDHFWENMHPPLRRMRARQGAFQFLVERLTQALEGTTPTQQDRTPIEEALEVLKALQAFTMEAMKDDAPLMSGLRKALEDTLSRAPKPAPAPPPAAETPEGARTQTAVQAQTAAALAELQSESDAVNLIMKGVDFLQEQNPASAVPYRVFRSVFWDPIEGEFPNERGTTFFEGPAEHVRASLNALAQSREWPPLLSVSEAQFREYPVWLDLQRFIASAMEGLGSAYQHARDAILYETAVLIKRVPGLARLSFSDGTPFADPATRFWLEQTVEPVLAAGSGEAGGPSSTLDGEALAEQYREAQQRLGEGDLAGALSVLQEGSQQDGAPRSRFRRRLYLAVLCMQGNQPAIARPVLEDLAAEVERLSLQDWEPVLSLDVWTNLYRCYDLLMGGEAFEEGLAERARRVFEKICQVDVTQALKASGA